MTKAFLKEHGGEGAMMVFTDQDLPDLFNAMNQLMFLDDPCRHGISVGLKEEVAESLMGTLRTDTRKMHLPPYLTTEFLARHASVFRPKSLPQFAEALPEGARLCGEGWVEHFGSDNPPGPEFNYMKQIDGMRPLFAVGTELSLDDRLRHASSILARVWAFDGG